MIAVKLNIQDEVYEKVMYFLDSLPQKDIQIIEKRVIDEIDPTTLPKDHFDYISPKEMQEIDKMSQMVKDGDLREFKDFEELKNEIQN